LNWDDGAMSDSNFLKVEFGFVFPKSQLSYFVMVIDPVEIVFALGGSSNFLHVKLK